MPTSMSATPEGSAALDGSGGRPEDVPEPEGQLEAEPGAFCRKHLRLATGQLALAAEVVHEPLEDTRPRAH